MGSTTLFTFLFDCPGAVRSIELFGSWDNFSKSHHLKRDRRRGSSTWSGCYTFEDIICDGDLENLGEKRHGALKMGGTYWYYYKVDDDQEYHNPSEESTTMCPLLPGQRLNVLEVPTESRSRSSSESSDVFTRNPADKYLTPIPPRPLPSPRLGDLCLNTYKVPMQSLGPPKSATYPSQTRTLSPGYERYVRSASTSPALASGPMFPDFRAIKDKISNSRGRSPHRRNVKHLEIGSPVLISTTAEDVNVVPLPSAVQIPKTSSSLPVPLSSRRNGFSPLGSNPVDPLSDFNFGFAQPRSPYAEQSTTRPRSHSNSLAPLNPNGSLNRARANSAGTRRTQVFVNEPWGLTHQSENAADTKSLTLPRAPTTLQKPAISLEPPMMDERPLSRQGGDRSPFLRKSPLDKELPPLPRYLVPAPLFACNEVPSPTVEDVEEEEESQVEIEAYVGLKPTSHFSLWSTESTFSSPTSEEDAIYSPTFSSLTSNASETGSPQRFSADFVHGDLIPDTILENDAHIQSTVSDDNGSVFVDSPVPQLHLRLSSFSSNLFQFDLHQSDSASRRQVSCFGASGFQGYSLPEDDATSQSTITKTTTPIQGPSISSDDRASSVNHLAQLMDEFGYLGDAVV
ncbi:hypothetical protein P154DRAFT_621760 [Amniculicola lignicola CBS 123094]|uniref:Uncharacterized protein n=1 Tax=Amniculicola lignicola CBS 123094 TaxID=1392246 RepID=A0A6A5W9K6_9PLEO|nr:hypothetical protein P154DRAFT_621760 [Amniculicola lignicola CBS 123094]